MPTSGTNALAQGAAMVEARRFDDRMLLVEMRGAMLLERIVEQWRIGIAMRAEHCPPVRKP